MCKDLNQVAAKEEQVKTRHERERERESHFAGEIDMSEIISCTRIINEAHSFDIERWI